MDPISFFERLEKKPEFEEHEFDHHQSISSVSAHKKTVKPLFLKQIDEIAQDAIKCIPLLLSI